MINSAKGLLLLAFLFYALNITSAITVSTKESTSPNQPASILNPVEKLSPKETGITPPPRKAGTLTVKINGSQYTGDLYEEINPYSYLISSGNKNYEIRIEWKYVTSPANIRENIIDLSENNSDVTVQYINFNLPFKYVTNSGVVIIKSNEGKKISGLFSFLANEENSSPNKNTDQQFTDGTFEINYGN